MNGPPSWFRKAAALAGKSNDEAYVKISRSGLLCLGLLLGSSVPSVYGQQPEPPQGPPPRSGTGGLQTPPPAIPKVPDVRQPGEYGWWAEINGWIPVQKAYIDKGKAAAFTTESFANLEGRPKYAEGAEIGMAVGLHNALRFSYFETKAAGDFRATNDLHLWTQDYLSGELISTNYRLQNGKISFEYLTWPFPVESRRFRLKTLWQVQYTGVRTEFGLPEAPIVDSSGLPLIDANHRQPGRLWRSRQQVDVQPRVRTGSLVLQRPAFPDRSQRLGFCLSPSLFPVGCGCQREYPLRPYRGAGGRQRIPLEDVDEVGVLYARYGGRRICGSPLVFDELKALRPKHYPRSRAAGFAK